MRDSLFHGISPAGVTTFKNRPLGSADPPRREYPQCMAHAQDRHPQRQPPCYFFVHLGSIQKNMASCCIGSKTYRRQPINIDRRPRPASPSIVPRRRQERSGLTPHDAVTADPPPKRHQAFAPDLDRHRPRLRRPVRLARIASAILVNKPPFRSFSPARTPTPWAKAMGSTASRHSLRARHPAQFPIDTVITVKGVFGLGLG
jgi:hypothetical protein